MASIWQRLGEGPNRRYARQEKAPDIIQELLKNTNLDTNTINDVVKGYVQGGAIQLPNMLSQDMQGPLNQNQMRETPTNSLRRPAYVYDETSDTFSRAPEGVDEPTRQVMRVNNPPRASAPASTAPRGDWYMDENGQWQRWVDPRRGAGKPDPYAGKDPNRVKEALATLAEHRKRLSPRYGPGGQVIPAQMDTELENRAIDAALYIGVPVHTETTPGDPGHSFLGMKWGDTPESKRIVIGDQPIDPNTFGNGQEPRNGTNQPPVQPRKQEATRSFNTVAEAEAARLPAGTIITVGGRRARVK